MPEAIYTKYKTWLIIYAEEIFCNYYMDLDYTKYIPKEYLLDGFDATKDNPYRKIMVNEWL